MNIIPKATPVPRKEIGELPTRKIEKPTTNPEEDIISQKVEEIKKILAEMAITSENIQKERENQPLDQVA